MRFLMIALMAAAVSAPVTARAATLTTIARFPTLASGFEPVALVAAKDGRLFGQTLSGGYGKCECGAVFSLTPHGTSYDARVIYAWPYGPADPDGLLLDPSGTIFGTTYQGAIGINGSAFELVPIGQSFFQQTIFQFAGSNGSAPTSLIELGGGRLAGAARGPNSNGSIIFELTPTTSGYVESVLYQFPSRSVGALPYGLTLGAGGVIYGSTALGGTSDAGVVYTLTPGSNGYVETTLLNFNGPNGSGPASNFLFDKRGNIFATANGGYCLDQYCFTTTGVAFELSPSRNGYTETLLHTFRRKEDGNAPSSALVAYHGAFYGTTAGGGKPYGNGTIYKLTPQKSGGYHETIVYAFSGPDGTGPSGLIAAPDGTGFFGYTYAGSLNGAGSVFKFVP